MTASRLGAWEVQVDGWLATGGGRKCWVSAVLINCAAVTSMPDPRVLKPVLRCLENHALANSELFRIEQDRAIVYRPVVQPGGRVRVYFRFDSLPPDRALGHLVLGDGDETGIWPAPLKMPDREELLAASAFPEAFLRRRRPAEAG